VLFQVKHFGGIRQDSIKLPASEGDAAAMRLGTMATLRLQTPESTSAP